MVESNRLEAIADDNERSLKTLVRAIKLSQRRFSLILAHCNYSSLREQMQQQLHQRSEVEIQELHLEGSSQDLYTTILNYFGEEPINALMVLGLESVEDLDKLLSATNKVRDQFSSFGFPVVLWVTDVILKKLVRIAPDFKNWASPPIQFTLNNEQLDDFLCQKAEQAFAEDPNFTLDSA
ncbi:hypothetical protein [Tolypothrix sp. VBCCA 56010]|uniref:hypothetical protein n=1 Tax=Tolypothrix sp. VBCCA 56010 TaxID=3137731 RepID=UPI003D7E57EB